MKEDWTEQRMEAVFEAARNWGRWGDSDEAGALNLITPEKRVEAARLPVSGEVISCARELAVHPTVENPHPALHMMIRGGDDCLVPGIGLEAAMDFVGVAFHGMATTHMDALCHVFVKGRMYNGFDAKDVKSTGAKRGSIMCAREGVLSRGVLLDIPRLLGVDWLDPGTAITVDQLEEAEHAQNVKVGSGDILLVATGRDLRKAKLGPWSVFAEGLAGLHPECIPWLRERDIAVLGGDGVSDALPGLAITNWGMPIHQCALVAMGVHLLDNLRLDQLSTACARSGRWEFLFVISPLRVEGATGSPVNPVALL